MARTAPAKKTAPTGEIDAVEIGEQTHVAALREIAVADIATNGTTPRTLFDQGGDAGIAELAASIKEQGLLQPIIVRPNVGEGAADVLGTRPTGCTGALITRTVAGKEIAAYRPAFLLVAGERRLRAVRDVLKRDTIMALVRADLGAETALEATVLENLQRRDLHPLEEARGLGQLRAKHGYTAEQIARKIGRSKEWVKDRLKLCDLPARAQDAYLRSTSGRLTLHKMLGLHEYTHGGRDDKGFPALIIALIEDMEKGINEGAHLGTLAVNHGGLIRRLTHWGHDAGGKWGGHYFDTRDVCRRCPFGAYRRGFYDGEGYCLLPDHYAELQAKGKARHEAAEAERERKRCEDPAYAKAEMDRQIVALGREKTAAQKGAETRKRHQQQKADYVGHVRAIERAIAQIANLDAIDISVLCAYTLTIKNVDREAVQEVIKRHGLGSFPATTPTPTQEQIARLRQIEPVALVRYTLEALLLTQARRARDYDPGKVGPDAVLALYLPGQAVPESPKIDAMAEVVAAAEATGPEAVAALEAMRERGREVLLPGVAEAKAAARAQGHDPVTEKAPMDEEAYIAILTCTACACTGHVKEDGGREGAELFDQPCARRSAASPQAA